MNSQQTLEVGKHIWDSNGCELVITEIDLEGSVMIYTAKWVNDDGILSTGCVVIFGSQIRSYSF